MQDEEKKREDEEPSLNVEASLTINRGYKLPLAKLSVSGSIQENEDQISSVVQRSVLFVIDRSGSMSGSRINMVREVLKPFVEEMCEDENTKMKVVLFDHNTELIEIPNNRESAGNLIEQRVRAQGGTDFYQASKGLVDAANQMLESHPTFQLTVIMCSDGEVGKDNALQGHSHWKQFVDSKYLRVHNIAPYVETIGISSSHDADVLSGFIVNDSCGNYVRCTDSNGIREAFENAQEATMGRSSIKLTIEFPLCVQEGVQMVKGQIEGSMKHDVIVTGDCFSQNFWVGVDELDKGTKGSNELFLTVNGQRVPIEIEEVTDDQQCQYEAIDFYECTLKDMLHTLRNITDPQQLKQKAKEIERELNRELIQKFAHLIDEPAEKRKMQQQIKALLVVGDEQKMEDVKERSARRAALMKEYKKMSKIWKKHRMIVMPFQQTLSGLKSLVREILLGQVRMQEIRQHILDLHFKKKHQKRIDRLVLSDTQLARRQQRYDRIEAPKEEDCMDVTDEMGSGCFLSTMSMRECVLDAEPLWICGRVDRSGGAQVSNPELIKIVYISPDLVSDSYFRMAIEAAAGGEVDAHGANEKENQNANVTFSDSSRQQVNCRLFPIYGNLAHFNCSNVFLNEALAHTLSGRIDIHAVDYNSLSAVIGVMISRKQLSQHNMHRLLFEVLPSMRMLLENTKRHPALVAEYNREIDINADKVSLAEKNRCRLVEYLKTFKARTTRWVSTANVLYADRLMNLDVKVDYEFYLNILLQRMRAMFSGQIPKDDGDNEGRKVVEENHKKLLQVLVCGVGRDDDNDGGDSKENENADENMLVFNLQTAVNTDFFAIIKAPKIDPINLDEDDEKVLQQYDPNQLNPSTRRMIQDILSKFDVRGMLRANAFFDILTKMGPNLDAKTCKMEEFSKHKYADFNKIPNDLNLLLTEIGCKDNMIPVLRAMCAVSILTHRYRNWRDNLEWFGDDKLKQIFNDPHSVLKYIYKNIVIKNIRRDYKEYLERKALQDMIDLHSNPAMPDDVDQWGNLPELRCGWKKCGRVFQNRDRLLTHVARFIPCRLIHRFHLRCRSVLEPNPSMSYEEFCKQALELFSHYEAKQLTETENYTSLKAYYDQFQPFFSGK